MNKSRKIILLMLSLMLSFILFGCGDIKLNSFTEINDDESGTAKFQIIYDNSVSNALNKTIFDQQWLKDNGFEFNNYTKDNMNVEEVKCGFKNLKDLQYKINLTQIINMSYSKKLGIGKNTYTINFSFNKSNIGNLLKKNISTGDQQKDEQIYNKYVKDVLVSNDIKIPGTIVNSNSVAQINDNTYEWNYKLSQIDENTNINISYALKSYLISGALAGGAALILGGSGYMYFKKRRG